MVEQENAKKYKALPQTDGMSEYSTEDAPLSVEEATRRFREAINLAAAQRLNALDAMTKSAREAYESLSTHDMDSKQNESNTEDMNEITREELDAKLAAVEARMDRRIADFGADMRQVVADFRVEMAPVKNVKANIWSAAGFVVASLIAIVGLTVTGFYTGRDTSNLINEAKAQTIETRKLLEQIKAQPQQAPESPAKQ